MDENQPIDIRTLGSWLEKQKISRTELASSLGLSRSTIDNYFSKGTIPKHIQILISRYIQWRDPVSTQELFSNITIPLSNRVLNLVMQAAVKKGISLEEFLAFSAEETAKATIQGTSQNL